MRCFVKAPQVLNHKLKHFALCRSGVVLCSEHSRKVRGEEPLLFFQMGAKQSVGLKPACFGDRPQADRERLRRAAIRPVTKGS